MNGLPNHCRDWMPRVAYGPALVIAAVAASVIGAGVSAYGSVEAGQAQARAADYQAQVALNNQKTAQSNANLATAAGAAQEQQNAMKTRAEIGGQLAAQASSGLDVNSGSAVNVRASTSALGELSGLNIVNNAARVAYGYQTQSSNYGAQAQLDTMEASSAATAGEIGAAGSIIQGFGGTGGVIENFQQTGAFNPGAQLSYSP